LLNNLFEQIKRNNK